jgi:hypothetical protein
LLFLKFWTYFHPKNTAETDLSNRIQEHRRNVLKDRSDETPFRTKTFPTNCFSSNFGHISIPKQ